MINNVVYDVLRYPAFHSVPIFFSLFKWSEGFKIYKLTTKSHLFVKEKSTHSSCALLVSFVQFAFSKAGKRFLLLDDPIPLSWSGIKTECWPISLQPFKRLHHFLNFEGRFKISPSHRWLEWGFLRTLASPNIAFKNKLFTLLSSSLPRSSGSFGKVSLSSFESLPSILEDICTCHLYLPSVKPQNCRAEKREEVAMLRLFPSVL